jgi:NOL1/NOP2/sun family putative RNA methylase
MKTLPPDFLNEMQQELGDSFSNFIDSYHLQAVKSLRTNLMKVTPEVLQNILPLPLEPVPWCTSGFYFPAGFRPGKHVYHAAGLYYIQEASAMAPVEALDPLPGEKILDLCAAPGGKTTQIAAKLNGTGLLVANEVDSKRCKALISNLERFGVTNTVVLNEQPHRISCRFPAFFDRILVDAPCSGEGMFRKDPTACDHWSIKNSEKCGDLQQHILGEAAEMLKPGGRLVYSTCTFNRRENEHTIELFLQEHPEFSITTIQHNVDFQPGLTPKIEKAGRLWPHLLRGEGHFVVVLEKQTGESQDSKSAKNSRLPKQVKSLLDAFIQDNFTGVPTPQNLVLYGDHLYEAPTGVPSLDKLKVAQPGRYIGEIRKGRFITAHALAMTLDGSTVKQVQSYTQYDAELYRFLQGETVPTTHTGWTLVTVDGYPLGWGKGAGGILKNHYPKWLRFSYDRP